MGRLIKQMTENDGEIFCKYLESRLIRNNKNVLGAELGPTGSGKSYRDLRKAELWYDYHFKEPFPAENICFGIPAVINLLSRGKLRKGEIIIFEEAGANLGSLDFQNKLAKMMTYVLQSFRSLNIAIFFNLPYLSMLNKSARMLLHYSFESCGIDYNTKKNKCKPFFHQVNQGTGKIYKKYPLVKINGRVVKVKRFNFSMPSQYLADAYEKKKAKYLADLTKGISKEIQEMGVGPKIKYPTELEYECYHLHGAEGLTYREIGERIGKSDRTVFGYVKKVQSFRDLSKKRNKNERGIGFSEETLLEPAET